MATIAESIHAKLMANGMFESQADEVIKLVKEDKANEAMIDRWNDQTTDYPEAIMNLAWMSARKHAREWIAKNKPMAWYRQIFD